MSQSVIHPGVTIGVDPQIGEFVVIGCLPRFEPAEDTLIGDRARIRSHSVIYAGVQIGERFFCGHQVVIRENCRIGKGVSIGTGCVIEHHVTIEDGVRLHSSVFVPEFTVLRAGCWIGPRACLTNAKYPTLPGVKENLAGPDIGAGAIVGANVTILPGVKVGERAMIGAGAVVTEDVQAGAVVIGNPARRVKSIDELSYGEEK